MEYEELKNKITKAREQLMIDEDKLSKLKKEISLGNYRIIARIQGGEWNICYFNGVLRTQLLCYQLPEEFKKANIIIQKYKNNFYEDIINIAEVF